MASPSSVLTRGLGTWGDVNLLITHGFGIAEEVEPTPVLFVVQANPSAFAVQANPSVFVVDVDP